MIPDATLAEARKWCIRHGDDEIAKANLPDICLCFIVAAALTQQDAEIRRLREEVQTTRDRLLDEFSVALKERGLTPQRQVYPFADALDGLLAAHQAVTQEAQTRLIAAAPEMLEFVAVVADFDPHSDGCHRTPCNCVKGRARVLLARMEGKKS